MNFFKFVSWKFFFQIFLVKFFSVRQFFPLEKFLEKFLSQNDKKVTKKEKRKRSGNRPYRLKLTVARKLACPWSCCPAVTCWVPTGRHRDRSGLDSHENRFGYFGYASSPFHPISIPMTEADRIRMEIYSDILNIHLSVSISLGRCAVAELANIHA